MSNVAVIANTQKIAKKDALRLRGALAAAELDARWYEIEKGSESKPAAKKALNSQVHL